MRSPLNIWPKTIEATTLPPRELKKTMRRNLESELPDLRKLTKVCGVSASITPSATMTSGQCRPHSRDSSGATRKLIEAPCSWAATGATATAPSANAAVSANNPLGAAKLVGGDGLEPPTL